MALGLASCSVEAPFDKSQNQNTAVFLKSYLSLDIKLDANIKVQSVTRDASQDLLEDFTIAFLKAGSTDTVRVYKYSEMPEVISIPEGSYQITATYGNGDLDAEWENPYFLGKSEEFSVRPDKVTTSIEPITCTLQNVMVSVVFDPELMEHISDAPEVEVYVNQNKSLTFKKEHSDGQIPGYFKHSEVNTLTAKFTGTVDGIKLTETKTLENVKPGNHYRLNFNRHSFNGEDRGDADLAIVVDANVSVNEVGSDYEIGEEEPLTDVTFPKEDNGDEEPGEGDNKGDDNNGDNNGDDDNPGDNNQGGDTPSEPENPGVSDGLKVSDSNSDAKLGIPYNVNENSKIALTFTSESGFQEFNVEVESTGGLKELIGEGSETGQGNGKLDLVNPGSMKEFLQQVNLLKGDSVGGLHEVVFDVSDLMGLLLMVDGTHTFNIHVKDSSGEINTSLILVVGKTD